MERRTQVLLQHTGPPRAEERIRPLYRIKQIPHVFDMDTPLCFIAMDGADDRKVITSQSHHVLAFQA